MEALGALLLYSSTITIFYIHTWAALVGTKIRGRVYNCLVLHLGSVILLLLLTSSDSDLFAMIRQIYYRDFIIFTRQSYCCCKLLF